MEAQPSPTSGRGPLSPIPSYGEVENPSALDRFRAELEEVDHKQAELASVQWKLMRDQTSTLAREIKNIRNEVTNLKVHSKEDSGKFQREIELRQQEQIEEYAARDRAAESERQ